MGETNFSGIDLSPVRLNDRDCGWCGSVATQGPFHIEGYHVDWYLCDYCAVDIEGVEPKLEFNLPPAEIVITHDNKTVARYTRTVIQGGETNER